MQEPNTMDQLTEEVRALLRAAQEIHAEHTGYRRSRQEPTCPWKKLDDAPASARTVCATTMPSGIWNIRRLSSGTPVGDTPGGTSTTSSSSAA